MDPTSRTERLASLYRPAPKVDTDSAERDPAVRFDDDDLVAEIPGRAPDVATSDLEEMVDRLVRARLADVEVRGPQPVEPGLDVDVDDGEEVFEIEVESEDEAPPRRDLSTLEDRVMRLRRPLVQIIATPGMPEATGPVLSRADGTTTLWGLRMLADGVTEADFDAVVNEALDRELIDLDPNS